jgi:hypothetical protein
MFVRKIKAYPKVKHLSDAPLLGRLQAFPHKQQARLESLARDKHDSLLRKSVNYGRKKFYNFGPFAKCYKKYTSVICLWQAFPP